MTKTVKKRIRGILPILLLCTLLFTACAGINLPNLLRPDPDTQEPSRPVPDDPAPEKDPPQPAPADPEPTPDPETPVLSVADLQGQLAAEGKAFAAAYLGYMTYDDETMWDFLDPRDDYLPLLLEVPDTNIAANTSQGEVYCLVPPDDDTNIKVFKRNGLSGDEAPVFDDLMYEKTGGAPYILVCNAAFSPDTMVLIDDSICWYPQLDAYLFVAGEDLLDFSPYDRLLRADYAAMQNAPDSGWIAPSAEDLIGTVWYDETYDPDGNYCLWQMELREDGMDVVWNPGYGDEICRYENAKWSLETKDGTAVLTVDFAEFAGVKSYNLLLDKEENWLYVSVDATRGPIRNEWERQYRFLLPKETGR